MGRAASRHSGHMGARAQGREAPASARPTGRSAGSSSVSLASGEVRGARYQRVAGGAPARF
ncbi:hypothetical protein [Acidithiobacillus sp.]|uniref:hypothetical protein n=1 Tax=Acidithiobacillus sp. TaxID=1872118 RepID=UPI003CFEA1C5